MTADSDPVPDESSLTDDNGEGIRVKAHEARIKYAAVMGLYDDFAKSVQDVIKQCLREAGIVTHSITARAKDPASFERKAAQLSTSDPSVAKYDDPLNQITDKAAVRITTYFLSTVEEVSQIISAQFRIIEKVMKTSSEPDRLGYQSVHYLVSYQENRTDLPEYKPYFGLVIEIQVRTILQHAWAEIEHDIQYKAVSVLPARIRRRFATLAGLIEIADREFQAIEDENRVIRDLARRNVDLGKLDQVEITRDSIRAYLDKEYGPDGRMSDFTYQYAASTLLALGFTNLAEVDECIGDIDDAALSRAIHGSRQGQVTRFEDVLLASMGENYVRAHPASLRFEWDGWYAGMLLKRLTRMIDIGIVVADFSPPAFPTTLVKDADIEALKAKNARQREATQAAREAAREAREAREAQQ